MNIVRLLNGNEYYKNQQVKILETLTLLKITVIYFWNCMYRCGFVKSIYDI